MLVLRHVPRRPRPLTFFKPPCSPRHGLPSNRRFFIQSLCDGFLDLAIALPIPPPLPPYSTTIILVTLFTRFALLPISIWGKNQSRKIQEVVMPEVGRMKPIVAKEVFEEMKRTGIRGDKEYLKQYHARRCEADLTALRKKLLQKHKCGPLRTMILPPLSQLPVFIGFTIILSRLSQDPTPFDSESFLTLTTLAHPDPTMTLPIVLGLITMANVESNNWLMNATERAKLRRLEQEKAKRITEKGTRSIKLGKVVKTALRGLSVLRIIIASVTPGSIALYWVTSATFGLIQTYVMDWMDIRRKRLLTMPVPVSDQHNEGHRVKQQHQPARKRS